VRYPNVFERITRIGTWDRDLLRNTMYWSPEVYSILELEPALAPHVPCLWSRYVMRIGLQWSRPLEQL